MFTTVAHSGLDGEVNRWANTVTRLSGTALYAVAAVRTIATYQPTEMRITVDGDGLDGRPVARRRSRTRTATAAGCDIAPDAADRRRPCSTSSS